MKKKGLLIFTFLMLVLNTVCFLYVDYAMQQDMSIYVLQVGRYKEKENANQIQNQLQELKLTSYLYQDQEYVVIQDVYLQEKQANQQAKELSQKGITCVVKEYLIDESYQEEIQKKNYKRIYPLLKQVDTK
ncbi:MAG: SPOR domain-containing protein [Bacillota bacterium]|nr:SPOR domain-containing protein [Bacillota bacterium]